MTESQFNDGWKILMRYLKDNGKFSDFKRITANSSPMFKKHLKKMFDVHPGLGWASFFSYSFFVGKRYGDYGQDFSAIADGWFKFYVEQRKRAMFGI